MAVAPSLPPGWAEVIDPSGRAYYADFVTRTSQWDVPKEYVHGCMQRQVIQGGAYWSGQIIKDGMMTPLRFWEQDAAWKRYADRDGRFFWSHEVTGVRFFEDVPRAPLFGPKTKRSAVAGKNSHCLIDSVATCRHAAQTLLYEAEIGVDIEGVDLCRHGRISLIQVATHSNDVFLFDITKLGPEAFERGGLRELLHSTWVRKVVFDGRADNDALHHLFGVVMDNAYDLQVLHALKFSSSNDRFVKRFSKCLEESRVLGEKDQREAKAVKEQGRRLFSPEHGGSYDVWEARPLVPELIEYAVADVQYLLRMKEQWQSRHLNSTVETLTRERIRKAINGPMAAKGAFMCQRDFSLDCGTTAAGQQAAEALAQNGWDDVLESASYEQDAYYDPFYSPYYSSNEPRPHFQGGMVIYA